MASNPIHPATPPWPASNPIGEQRRSSNMRFRSFAERYLVTRSAFFRQDEAGLQEDIWKCVLDAKRVYKLIGEVGINVQDD
jgi:hypothetical protein